MGLFTTPSILIHYTNWLHIVMAMWKVQLLVYYKLLLIRQRPLNSHWSFYKVLNVSPPLKNCPYPHRFEDSLQLAAGNLQKLQDWYKFEELRVRISFISGASLLRPLKNVQFCSSTRKVKILTKGIYWIFRG